MALCLKIKIFQKQCLKSLGFWELSSLVARQRQTELQLLPNASEHEQVWSHLSSKSRSQLTRVLTLRSLDSSDCKQMVHFFLLHWPFAALCKMVFPRFGGQEDSKQRAACLNTCIIFQATPQGLLDFPFPAATPTHTLHS